MYNFTDSKLNWIINNIIGVNICTKINGPGGYPAVTLYSIAVERVDLASVVAKTTMFTKN